MRKKIAYYSIRFYYLMCIFEANDRTIKCGISIEFMIWEKKGATTLSPRGASTNQPKMNNEATVLHA